MRDVIVLVQTSEDGPIDAVKSVVGALERAGYDVKEVKPDATHEAHVTAAEPDLRVALSEPEIGDVVDAHGMRAIVRDTRPQVVPPEVLVAAGRTDPGVWLPSNEVRVLYRPPARTVPNG